MTLCNLSFPLSNELGESWIPSLVRSCSQAVFFIRNGFILDRPQLLADHLDRFGKGVDDAVPGEVLEDRSLGVFEFPRLAAFRAG